MASERDRIKSQEKRINREWDAVKSDQKSGYQRERKILPTLLGDGESIVAWLRGKYARLSGESEQAYFDGVVVATDRRVLFLQDKNDGNVNTVAMAYQAIEGVHEQINRGFWSDNTVLDVMGSGSTSMKVEIGGSQRAVRDFVDRVNQQIYEAGATGQVTQQASPMEELRKAAELHANGILTDSEFEAIKTELLSRI